MPRGRPKGSGNKPKVVKEKNKLPIVKDDSGEKYVDGYRGKEVVQNGMKEYDVLCIVRDAMRGEHSRFDWIKFLLDYRNTTDYDAKKKLIHKYAPSVVCT